MNKFKVGLVILLSLVLLGMVGFIGVKLANKNTENDDNNTLYSDKAIEAMKKEEIYEELIKKDYSELVEYLLENDLYEKKYQDEYYKIQVSEKEKANNINELLDNDYSGEEVNYILTNSIEVINILLDMEHIDILKLKEFTNFEQDKMERYLNYYKNNDYDLENAVTYVNIGLDLEGYSKYSSYTNEEADKDLTILVNKYHKLPDDYEPDDLTPLSYNDGYYKLRKDAAEAFEKLTSAALLDNVVFYPFSAYRSFSTQNRLYNRYVSQDGVKVADTYSARPGFSEHQLGLAVDVRSSTLNDNLTPEHYEWMLNNSYKYGFIVRYPKGKQYITQYMEEPWHIRYLGIDLATKVHDSGLTYDEYYDIYMTKH